MTTLPKAYAWLANEPGPRLLTEALKTFGTVEKPGPNDNPAILAWAAKVGLKKVYLHDSTAWCGLWMAYVAMQAGWDLPVNPLWARNWVNWGNAIKGEPMLGDVGVFDRGRGNGHVGIIVGEGKDVYYVLAGNQTDQVMIKPIAKKRLIEARRCPWRVNQPGNVRRVFLSVKGALSTNEA